jgi:hypothetical protein
LPLSPELSATRTVEIRQGLRRSVHRCGSRVHTGSMAAACHDHAQSLLVLQLTIRRYWSGQTDRWNIDDAIAATSRPRSRDGRSSLATAARCEGVQHGGTPTTPARTRRRTRRCGPVSRELLDRRARSDVVVGQNREHALREDPQSEAGAGALSYSRGFHRSITASIDGDRLDILPRSGDRVADPPDVVPRAGAARFASRPFYRAGLANVRWLDGREWCHQTDRGAWRAW